VPHLLYERKKFFRPSNPIFQFTDVTYFLARDEKGEVVLRNPEEARKEIFDAASRAVARAKTIRPLRISGRCELRILCKDSAFRDGDAGLMVGSFDDGGVDIRFDNFVVYKP
jgi:hypothetical protein